jgi:hypothetical protein
MRQFVGHPHGDEISRKPHAIGLRVHPPGEMFQADEGDAAATHHQLSGIGAPQPDHEVRVGWIIHPDQLLCPCDRVLGELDDVGRRRQRIQVATVRLEGGGYDLFDVGSFGIENVVTPVGVEDEPVSVAILAIRCLPIGGFENRQKIRKEIDQHARAYEFASQDAIVRGEEGER